MNKTNPNESAFTMPANHTGGPDFPEYGLTKREYFAGVALQSICAGMILSNDKDRAAIQAAARAEDAVLLADKMVDALNGVTP